MDKHFLMDRLKEIQSVLDQTATYINLNEDNMKASETMVYCDAIGKLNKDLAVANECNRNAMDKVKELRKIIKDKDEQINDLQERSDDLQEQLNKRCEQVEQLECKLNSVYDKIDTLYRITSGNIE